MTEWEARGASGDREGDQDGMAMARGQRESSHDPHCQVGCAIVTVDGRNDVRSANRFPEGVDVTAGRIACKADWLGHAELMAIFTAARRGVSLEGATLYTTRFPCGECGGGIVAAGIARVVCPAPELGHHRWGKSMARAVEKFQEAGVLVDEVS